MITARERTLIESLFEDAEFFGHYFTIWVDGSREGCGIVVKVDDEKGVRWALNNVGIYDDLHDLAIDVTA